MPKMLNISRTYDKRRIGVWFICQKLLHTPRIYFSTGWMFRLYTKNYYISLVYMFITRQVFRLYAKNYYITLGYTFSAGQVFQLHAKGYCFPLVYTFGAEQFLFICQNIQKMLLLKLFKLELYRRSILKNQYSNLNLKLK